MAAGDLGEEDCGLGRLPLAEQDRLVPGGRFGGPMGEQLAGVGGDAVPVIGAPDLDLAADVVDQGVLFPALPGGVEVEGLLGATSTFPVAGTGMKDSLGRRPRRSCPVGPVGPISKWASGA